MRKSFGGEKPINLTLYTSLRIVLPNYFATVSGKAMFRNGGPVYRLLLILFF